MSHYDNDPEFAELMIPLDELLARIPTKSAPAQHQRTKTKKSVPELFDKWRFALAQDTCEEGGTCKAKLKLAAIDQRPVIAKE